MKIIFFGLGSIGKRHATLLKQKFNHQVFAFRSAKSNRLNTLKIQEVYTWDHVKKIKPDIAFITNPTYLHIETALRCAGLGMNLFIEKPLGHTLAGVKELLDLVKSKKLAAYVAYNLRFHPLISFLKEVFNKHRFIHMRISCTSYLPDWRSGTDYQDCYSAQGDMGGGVILDLSHELDYCQFLAGEIQKIEGRFGNIGNLSIKAEDFADLHLQTKIGPANIHLNMFSNNLERKLIAEFENKCVKADLINNCIEEISTSETIERHQFSVTMDETYLKQMQYFFSNLENPAMMNNIFEAEVLFRKILLFKEKGSYGS